MIQEANRTGIGIDSTKVLWKFNPNGYFLLDIVLNATGDATYVLEQADGDETSFIETKEYTSTSTIDDVLEGVAGTVRIRLKTAASGGSTADFYIGVGD